MSFQHVLHEKCYINGLWCDADGGGVIAVTDPGSGQ